MKNISQFLLLLAPALLTVTTLSAQQSPITTTAPQVVVLIPGIMGSVLRTADGNNTRVWMRLLPNFLTDLDITNTLNVEDIVRVYKFAGDDTKSLLDGKDVYQPLITALTGAGFVEYNYQNNQWAKDGRPEPITPNGCDKTQNKATLFIFPYDWRLSNAITANFLKEYIDCIRQIYPDVTVDIVAHSMGGLLARRMILDTNIQKAGMPHPYVRSLITLGTPYWGSPKADYKMERGDFFGLPRINALFGWNPANIAIRDTLRPLPALHELLPTQALFDNAPANQKPFGEGGPARFGAGNFRYWDINGSSAREDDYNYSNPGDNPPGYKVMMDTRFTNLANLKPMTNNDNFHGFANANGFKQDDWGGDKTGVTYYHIIGIGKETVVKLEASLFLGVRNVLPNGGNKGLMRGRIRFGQHFRETNGDGDGTVPRLSAERTAATNAAPPANMRVFKGIEHIELVQDPDPLNCVLNFLGKNANCPAGEKLFQLTMAPASERIQMVNVQNVAVSDPLGNRIDVDVNSQVLPLYGVTDASLTLPPGQEVFITFNTLDDPDASSFIRIMTNDDNGNDVRKIIYLDPQTRFDRPPESVNGILGRLHIDPAGNTTLQFDWNLDGVINNLDQAVVPTVDTTNPSMIADELGPSISVTNITTGSDGLEYVTLAATDPSGLLTDTVIGTPPFLASLQNDGDLIDNMAKYIIGSTVAVPPGSQLTACAVDAAANRACELFNIP